MSHKKYKINIFDECVFGKIIDSYTVRNNLSIYNHIDWQDYQLTNFPETIGEIIKRFKISNDIKEKYKDLFDSEEIGLL